MSSGVPSLLRISNSYGVQLQGRGWKGVVPFFPAQRTPTYACLHVPILNVSTGAPMYRFMLFLYLYIQVVFDAYKRKGGSRQSYTTPNKASAGRDGEKREGEIYRSARVSLRERPRISYVLAYLGGKDSHREKIISGIQSTRNGRLVSLARFLAMLFLENTKKISSSFEGTPLRPMQYLVHVDMSITRRLPVRKDLERRTPPTTGSRFCGGM